VRSLLSNVKVSSSPILRTHWVLPGISGKNFDAGDQPSAGILSRSLVEIAPGTASPEARGKLGADSIE
jgi:hypothetical protein